MIYRIKKEKTENFNRR